MPLILIFVIVLITLIGFFSRRSHNVITQSEKDFWNKENQANFTRKQSTDDIEYINFTMDCLPTMDETNSELAEYYKKLRSISGKPIANLSSYTNTELKLKYGAPNFMSLYHCDENYIQLVRIMNQISEYYIDRSEYEKSIPYLKYSIKIDQTPKSYALLVRAYLNLHMQEELSTLKDEVYFVPEPKRTSILNMIKNEEQNAICNDDSSHPSVC